MDERRILDSSEEDPADGPATGADEWKASMSNSFRGMVVSMTGVLTNLNLVGSLALLAALVSFWLDFRDAYTATKSAINELSPIAAALLPSILVGLTVFVIVWCAVYGWRYVQSMRAKLAPDLKMKAELKKLVPDIESCLFFLEEAGHVKDERSRHRVMSCIGESCLSLWEDMESAGLGGPTTYSIQSALPYGHEDEPDVKELHRLIKTLVPVARSGNVKEASRIY